MSDKAYKQIKVFIYITNIIALMSLIPLVNFKNKIPQFIYHELISLSGYGCLLLIGLEISLLVSILLLKNNSIEIKYKKFIQPITKNLKYLHNIIGLTIICLVIFHLVVNVAYNMDVGFSFLYSHNFITGYIATAILILCTIFGIFCTINRKKFKTLHVSLSFIAILTILIHILF